MPEKYKIAKKKCNYCSGNITWDKKIDDKYPVHVDDSGFSIGNCGFPQFGNQGQARIEISSMDINPHMRFTEPNNNLPIFQGKKPFLERYYIGKVTPSFVVEKFIIRVNSIDSKFKWRYAYGILRYLMEHKNIISFFKLLDSDDFNSECFIHLYIYEPGLSDFTELKDLIIQKLNDLAKQPIFSNENIIYSSQNKEEINPNNIQAYAKRIKKFFDSITSPLRFKFKDGEYICNIFFEYIDNILYYYADLDAIIYSEGVPVKISDKGKQVLGVLKEGKKKYRLLEILETNIDQTVDDIRFKDINKSFIEYSQNRFQQKGFQSMKDENTEWSIKDFWSKINGVEINGKDKVAIVEDNKKRFFFPMSRLSLMRKDDVSREKRYHSIQNNLREIYFIIEDKMKNISKPHFELILPEQLIPKYYDLIDAPFIVQFAGGVEFELKRKNNDPYQLNKIPQDLLRDRSNKYKPLAGTFNFLLVPIIPKITKSYEQDNTNKLMESIKQSLFSHNLASSVTITDSINYTWNDSDINERKLGKWSAYYDVEIEPLLEKIMKNDKITLPTIILPFFGVRDIGITSRSFKFYIQNQFYKSIARNILDKEKFSIIQSFNIAQYKSYQGSKLAVMSYRNSLFNIASSCPDSYIAKRIEGGLLFKSKYPFGTRSIDKPIESIEMMAGFDASKIEGEEYSKPRGAVIVTSDPYGKQIMTYYIQDALTHKGKLSESVIKDLLMIVYKHQEKICKESKEKGFSFPRKLVFLHDGDMQKIQKDMFLKVYKELIETGLYPTLPEIIFFEVLKSHKVRLGLLDGQKVLDIPFGTLAILNSFEFLIKGHIWQRKTMVQPLLYRFKMRLSERYNNIIRHNIYENEIVNIATQLQQSTLFNTGKSGRPLKQAYVVHESHKLSFEFGGKPDAINTLFFKD